MKKYFIKVYLDDKRNQSDKGSASSSGEIKASSADFAAGKSYQGVLKKADDHDFEREYKKRKVDSGEKDDIKIIEPSPDKTNETISNEIQEKFINLSRDVLKTHEDILCLSDKKKIYTQSGGFSLEEYDSLKAKFEKSTKTEDADNIIKKMEMWLNKLEILKDFHTAYELLKTTYYDTHQLFNDKSIMRVYNQPDFPHKEYNSLTEKFEKVKKSTKIENFKNITIKMELFTSELDSVYETKGALEELKYLNDMYTKIKRTYNTLLFSLKEAEIFKRSGILPETYKSLMVTHESIMRELQMTVKDFKKAHAEIGWNEDFVLLAIDETAQGQTILNKLEKLKVEVEQSRQQNRIHEAHTSRFSPNYRGNQAER
jgi:hypothetical protein